MYNKNRNLFFSILWVVLGTALLVLSTMKVLDSSVYAAMGGALIAVGALQLIRNAKYRGDSAYREKMDTAVSDERNQFIRMKSWSLTGYIVVLTECIGVIIAMILGRTAIRQVLETSVCLIVGVYWITYLIVSRKY